MNKMESNRNKGDSGEENDVPATDGSFGGRKERVSNWDVEEKLVTTELASCMVVQRRSRREE